MRVLLRDSRDDTLIAVEAIEVNYDPTDTVLTVCLCTEEYFEISGIRREMADTIVTDLYNEGKISLKQYPAVYNSGDEYGDPELCEGPVGPAEEGGEETV